jgi:hypothetical protein
VEHHLRRWFPANQSYAEVIALGMSDNDTPRQSLAMFVSYGMEMPADDHAISFSSSNSSRTN